VADRCAPILLCFRTACLIQRTCLRPRLSKARGIPLVVFLLGLFLQLLQSVWVSVFWFSFWIYGWYSGLVLEWLDALVCGIYYPISILPFPLPQVAQVIPLTYFLAYFRSFYGFNEGLETFRLGIWFGRSLRGRRDIPFQCRASTSEKDWNAPQAFRIDLVEIEIGWRIARWKYQIPSMKAQINLHDGFVTREP